MRSPWRTALKELHPLAALASLLPLNIALQVHTMDDPLLAEQA